MRLHRQTKDKGCLLINARFFFSTTWFLLLKQQPIDEKTQLSTSWDIGQFCLVWRLKNSMVGSCFHLQCVLCSLTIEVVFCWTQRMRRTGNIFRFLNTYLLFRIRFIIDVKESVFECEENERVRIGFELNRQAEARREASRTPSTSSSIETTDNEQQSKSNKCKS